MTQTTKYIDELIQDIKDKKELRTLDEDFVKQKLDVFLDNKNHDKNKERAVRKMSDAKTYKQFSKSKEFKFLIKEMRSELRKVYGVFILEGYEKRKKILDELKDVLKENNANPSEENNEKIMGLHNRLFTLHKSTKERMDHYEELYRTIFDTIEDFSKESKLSAGLKNPEELKRYVIMDIACGLNPISSILFKEKIKKYYASDISTEDCEFLKEYFDTTDIDAVIFPADLVEKKIFYKLEKIPVDVCFIFKTLDGLERVERNITEELLKSINTKYFAVTFPTLSIGGLREIKEHRRLWFERLLEKLEWRFEKFTLDSELLYVVEKT